MSLPPPLQAHADTVRDGLPRWHETMPATADNPFVALDALVAALERASDYLDGKLWCCALADHEASTAEWEKLWQRVETLTARLDEAKTAMAKIEALATEWVKEDAIARAVLERIAKETA